MDCNCSSCSCNRKVTDRYYRLTRVVYSGGLVRLNIVSPEQRDAVDCDKRLQGGL